MPASRIVFALNDLIGEIDLLAKGGGAIGTLALPVDAYRAVRSEFESHLGGKMAGTSLFKFNGFTVTCLPDVVSK